MTSAAIDLSALMRRAQAGDKDAYRQLLVHARAAALGYVRRRLHDPQAAEDVCQNALLKLHTSRHTYDPAQPFPPWLFAIVRNALVDHLRRHKRTAAKVDFVDDYPEDRGDAAIAEAALIGNEALAKLSDEQRSTIEMIKVEGLTMEEASERSGVSVAAMKVRAHRAYKVLRSAFSKEDDEAS